jgi:hypothetical protein
MQLTYAGQVFLVMVAILCVWSFVLTKFWLKRLAKNRDSSKFEFAYLFVVVFSVSSLFFSFTYWVSQAIFGFIALRLLALISYIFRDWNAHKKLKVDIIKESFLALRINNR